MGTIPRPRVLTKDDLEAADLPDEVTVALAEIAGAAKEGLLALSVGLGLAVMHELFEDEVTKVVGPKGKHDPGRSANRHGHERRKLPLGGRLVGVAGPRVRTTAGKEVELTTYRVFSSRDLLREAALGRMLAGLSTRRYRAGLEPVGKAAPPAGTSRSAVSRRFVTCTAAKLACLFGRALSGLDLLAVFIDGMAVGDHLIVVALGVDSAGRKHPLGLWEGTMENKAVCSALLSNLIDRGLPTERALLFVIDGGKGIRSAIKAAWGELALVQRCRKHSVPSGHARHGEEEEVVRIA